MKKTGNMYANLKIDIPTLRGVLIEKFKEPFYANGFIVEWCDKNDELHSFNGFPSSIVHIAYTKGYVIKWHKHGVEIRKTIILKKTESEIIAEKISARNFQRRASKNK